MKARKGGGRGETTDRQTLLNLHPLSAPERSHASHGSATQSGFCLLETAGSCVYIRRSKAHGEEAIRWGGGGAEKEGGREEETHPPPLENPGRHFKTLGSVPFDTWAPFVPCDPPP